MLPPEIKQWFETNYGAIESFTSASGGCINNGGTIESGKEKYFLKYNSSSNLPNMFKAEATGLDLLRKSELYIPKVIDVFEGLEYDALLLENVTKSVPNGNFWSDFGYKLAAMHHITKEFYGLDHNNYMGSLPQENEFVENWINFFIVRRLMPQVSLANSKGYFNNSQTSQFEKFYKKLPELLNVEIPALVHGDLWSGNFIINHHGDPVLIDPAVSYSHREVDLAMTKLFGGFDQQFYEAYLEAYPTVCGLEDRMDIYNLYPLLIHLNLFGAGYYSQVMHIISRFS